MVDYKEEEELEDEFLVSVLSICRSVCRFRVYFVKGTDERQDGGDCMRNDGVVNLELLPKVSRKDDVGN